MSWIKKNIGIGTMAIVLFTLGVVFSLSIGKYGTLGDHILHGLGLKAWSRGNTGTHYTVFYSLLFFLPACFIGHRYSKHLGAITGRNFSLILVALIVISVFFLVPDTVTVRAVR